jgi:hypothetical protein
LGSSNGASTAVASIGDVDLGSFARLPSAGFARWGRFRAATNPVRRARILREILERLAALHRFGMIFDAPLRDRRTRRAP